MSLRTALLGTPASALTVQVAASLGSAAAGGAAAPRIRESRRAICSLSPSHMYLRKEPHGGHATWHPEAEAQGRCRVRTRVCGTSPLGSPCDHVRGLARLRKQNSRKEGLTGRDQ